MTESEEDQLLQGMTTEFQNATQDSIGDRNSGRVTQLLYAIHQFLLGYAQLIGIAKVSTVSSVSELSSFVRGGAINTVLVSDPVRGGIFNYFPSGYVADGSMVITSAGGGFWVRHYDKTGVQLGWFGGVSDYNTGTGAGTDNFSALESAYNYAISNRVNKITLTDGAWGFSKIASRGVSLVGNGPQVRVYALVSANTSFLTIIDAPTQQIQMSDIRFFGNASNVNQHGLDFTAVPQLIPSYTGGFWYSTVDRVSISGFGGDALRLIATDGAGTSQDPRGDLASQFLTFRDVRINRANATGRCMYVNGQLGQALFENCYFQGISGLKTGTNVFFDNTTVGNAGAQGNFINCTFQDADTAIKFSGVRTFTVYGSWYENLITANYVDAGSNINIRDCHFANAANTGGYLLKVDGNGTTANFSGNDIGGSVGGEFAATNNAVILDLKGNSYSDPNHNVASLTLVKNWFIPSGGQLTAGNFRQMVITTTTNSLATLVSTCLPTEEIVIRPNENGAVDTFVRINNTGNITLPAWANGEVILRQGDIARLIKQDIFTSGNAGYILDFTPGPRKRTAAPTTGQWFKNEFVINTAPSAGAYYGWVCITAGSPGTWKGFGLIEA